MAYQELSSADYNEDFWTEYAKMTNLSGADLEKAKKSMQDYLDLFDPNKLSEVQKQYESWGQGKTYNTAIEMTRESRYNDPLVQAIINFKKTVQPGGPKQSEYKAEVMAAPGRDATIIASGITEAAKSILGNPVTQPIKKTILG